MRKGKSNWFRRCCHCCEHKNHQILKNRYWTECSKPPNSRKSSSNHLGWPTSTTNYALLPATPINHTYQCHVLVLFPLHMLNLTIGKGRRVIKFISTHTSYYTPGLHSGFSSTGGNSHDCRIKGGHGP